jgi:transcriptional regulator GlxA family with amidase domain
LQKRHHFEGTHMNTKLNHIQNWVEFAQQVNWSVTRLAKRCKVSTRTLERYFLKEMNKTPKAWLIEQRQRQAIELLRDGSTIKEAAGYLDYKHPSHLTNGFKKHWGHCPTNKSASMQVKNP